MLHRTPRPSIALVSLAARCAFGARGYSQYQPWSRGTDSVRSLCSDRLPAAGRCWRRGRSLGSCPRVMCTRRRSAGAGYPWPCVRASPPGVPPSFVPASVSPLGGAVSCHACAEGRQTVALALGALPRSWLPFFRLASRRLNWRSSRPRAPAVSLQVFQPPCVLSSGVTRWWCALHLDPCAARHCSMR
eukprot:4798083-Pleurochrysis_carterae.AAC.1